MKRITMRPRTYLALCALACVSPLVLVLARLPGDGSLVDEILFSLAGSFVASILTYPSGAIAAVASTVPVYWGVLTPIEAVAVFAPLYMAVGYMQWYVVIPRYFMGSAGHAVDGAAKSADAEA